MFNIGITRTGGRFVGFSEALCRDSPVLGIQTICTANGTFVSRVECIDERLDGRHAELIATVRTAPRGLAALIPLPLKIAAQHLFVTARHRSRVEPSQGLFKDLAVLCWQFACAQAMQAAIGPARQCRRKWRRVATAFGKLLT